MNRQRIVTALALLCGGSDTLTGLGLLIAPLPLLSAMGIHPLPAEPVFQRWIGAFVFGVGVSYLYPYFVARHDLRARFARLRTVFEVTAMMRLFVALSVGGAIAAGELERAWGTVAAFDFAVALAQVALLRNWRELDG